jgi:succinate dehydrogenase / fumarate reductase flavoprotein subunit
MMGGVRVDAETQMSDLPGLFAAGECGAGLHGANRLGGNSLSDLLVFGQRAGRFAAQFAKENRAARCNPDQVDEAARDALAPFARTSSENPFSIQQDLQAMMQDLVGIVRHEPEMIRALGGLETLKKRAAEASVGGNREYNPGWHTALDLHHLLTVSEAITRSALDRKESRGAHFRDDFPGKDEAYAKFNIVVRRGTGGSMEIHREPLPPLTAEQQNIIEEMK